MCECDKDLALMFPFDTLFGREYGSQKEYPVFGFESYICDECRGLIEKPYPRAYGTKIERFYWREISKTYLELLISYLLNNNQINNYKYEYDETMIESIKRRYEKLGNMDHFNQVICNNKNIYAINTVKIMTEQKLLYKNLMKNAKEIWTEKHKINPKYDIKEITPKEFLEGVNIPEIKIFALSKKKILENNSSSTYWINDKDKIVKVEEIAADYYKKEGYTVWLCEGKLISILIAYICDAISKIENEVSPKDFGSHYYYEKREKTIKKTLDRVREGNYDIFSIKDSDRYASFKTYLGVKDKVSQELLEFALANIPSQFLSAMIEWSLYHFWDRRAGWPDLLLANDKGFKFVEVKSENDKLTKDQMAWFKWAINKANIPCEICNVSG